MRRDLVAERVGVSLGVGHPLQVNASVQLIPLAGLDEEQLGLSGQGRAALGVEVSPVRLNV